MITIAHARDDMELLFIRMALEADGIPFLVVGDGFGSLYPGLQLPIFNERPVRVDEGFVERAAEIVNEVRADFDPVSTDLAVSSKLRMVLEAVLFAWFLPAGKRRGFSAKAPDTDTGQSGTGQLKS